MTDPYETEARNIINGIKIFRARLAELADLRPPITLADITPDMCNIPDREIAAEIQTFRNRFNQIDVSDFTADDGCSQNIEDWELVAGGSLRYSSREIYLEGDDDDVKYDVIDTEDGDRSVLGTDSLFDDGADADNECMERNRDATMESLHGFPFAHNYGVVIEQYDVELFANAGFLVWRYKGDKLIAGIDGGGYSFEGAHWAPLFHARAVLGGWLVETSTGPRRVR